MFLKNITTGDLIEVLEPQAMMDPFKPTIRGRTQAGEDTMDIGEFNKALALNPEYKKAKESIKKARDVLEKLKQVE